MTKRKPILVYLVAIGYFLAPLINVWQGWIYARPLDWHDILLMSLYPIVGYGLIRFRSWGWYLLIVHAVFLFVNNAIVGLVFGGVDRPMLLQLNLLILILLWYFLRRSVSSPFHDPALRWWERQSPRHGATFAASFKHTDHGEGSGTGFNLSDGGCFVCLEEGHGLSENDLVDLELHAMELEPFSTQARVAWLSDGSDGSPRGAGMEFRHTNSANRRRLLEMLSQARTHGRGQAPAAGH